MSKVSINKFAMKRKYALISRIVVAPRSGYAFIHEVSIVPRLKLGKRFPFFTISNEKGLSIHVMFSTSATQMSNG